MKRYEWIWIAALLLLVLCPLRFSAFAETRCSIVLMDAMIDKDFGAKVVWDDCKCVASKNIFTISEGKSIPAQVEIPSKLASWGVAGAKPGDKLSITWLERDRWLVEHSVSGKTIKWRWRMPLPPPGQ